MGSDQDPGQGRHWSDSRLAGAEAKTRCSAIGVWQSELVWLLDYFRSYPEIIGTLKLRLLDRHLIEIHPGKLDARSTPFIAVTAEEFAIGSAAWQGYRAVTPKPCLDLLGKNLSALPLLRSAFVDLLDELPSASTGLAATEMRMLALVGRGCSRTNALFHLGSLRQTRVFNEFEYGYLLEGLAHVPTPAVAGLDDHLRTIPQESFGCRLDAYYRSNLSITDFGRAILAHEEDFSRHNPIDRRCGGTHLTSDNLWRYDRVLIRRRGSDAT